MIISLILALLLDRLFGEPRYAHPLVGFGHLVSWVEKNLNVSTGSTVGSTSVEHPRVRLKSNLQLKQKFYGGLGVLLLTLPPVSLLFYIESRLNSEWRLILLNGVVLYLAIGARSLVQHAHQVRDALLNKNIEHARIRTSYLVSRDTAEMKPQDMARATIESTLENGSDALFAPLFWFLIAGAPGVLFYRLANTLDAMWGYKTPRFHHFGWAAARLDDLLNFIPARLTALSYALTGKFTNAMQCWLAQADQCASPNAGPVMAAGAGALSLQLGGPAMYHGQLQDRPPLGKGSLPEATDIDQAINLLHRSLGLWLLILILVWGGLHLA